MNRPNIQFVTSDSLPYLLSVPGPAEDVERPWPVLCFLHGYDEGAPTAIREALTRHGPLSPKSASIASSEFIVVAPQLPRRGDIWHRYAKDVQHIVQQVQTLHRGHRKRTFLTGFSFGGNGVLDLALEQREFWHALWPVDPTRAPAEDPALPVWLSAGELSRRSEALFIERMQLKPMRQGAPTERVYVDDMEDHVTTATLAYQDERIYRWLLGE